MDTSDYTGEPHLDAVAHAMDPAIASVAAAALRDVDLRAELVGDLQSVLSNQAVLAPVLASIGGILEPVWAQMDNLAATAAQGMVLDSGIGLGADLRGMMDGHVIDDEWFSRIADSIGLTIDDSVYRDLVAAVNQTFTAFDTVGVLDDPADARDETPGVRAAVDEVDLGELGEAGRAFVAQEGRGLSWEAKKRLFLLFVGATLLLALVQAMVVNEAAKELLEDGSTALAYVVPALAAASVGWDRVMPRPEDPDEDPDTES